MLANRTFKLATLWLVCALVSSCGYRFSGSGELPSGIKSVFISMFENRTNEIGLESRLTNDLTNEFILNRKGIQANPSRAEGIVTGIITGVYDYTISETASGVAVEREIAVYVSLKLTDQQGNVLWSRTGLSEKEPFDVGLDRTITEKNKREAIVEVSEKLAERVYNSLTEKF